MKKKGGYAPLRPQVPQLDGAVNAGGQEHVLGVGRVLDGGHPLVEVDALHHLVVRLWDGANKILPRQVVDGQRLVRAPDKVQVCRERSAYLSDFLSKVIHAYLMEEGEVEKE